MFNKYVILKVISVLIAALSQILLKKSALKHYDNRVREYLNVLVIVAYALFFASSILGIYSLRGISISFSTIIESLSYILIPVLSYLFFKEKISQKQFVGTFIIIVGIVIFNIWLDNFDDKIT